MLELRSVCKRYDGQEVSREVSLRLSAGEIGALLGPSGCGKTTLLRMIAGFEDADAGQILLRGAPVHGLPPEKRRVGFVFQDYALFPHLDVRANVGFGLRGIAAAEKTRIVDEWCERLGLVALARRKPHELSGGEQQRVAVARALAPKPDLVLLDEPFSSLDAELRARLSLELRSLLKSLRTTALFVTHDQTEAFAVADVTGVMSAGRLEQWGSAFDLYHRPASPFVATFVGEGVLVTARLREDGVVETALGPYRGPLPEDGSARGERRLLLRPEHVVIDESSPVRGRLESRFFRGSSFLCAFRLTNGERVLALAHHESEVEEETGLRLNGAPLSVF